ncbi:hypothetical protein ITP53_02980 [Nonomuraea sp. K274]|uniref:Protein kinase domain-containing protein n=1 Tax=Nonomuraea cypriaca TaxID=1187855 RepID=A0A931A1Y8_9ACTN|nr:hypothetical protein [Nonomuraea cypriaca]MBF8184721.1 hypothetical protein [Nonomuraea cypriaca]
MGPYRIVGRLGAGGMGIVYAGVDSAGQRAAVKLIHDMHAANQEFRVRFRREVAMLRRVQGACCVRMLAADAEARQPWLATEYIAGRTLDEHVGVEGPLSGDGLYGLAAALDLALSATPAATFSFHGAFTQSTVSAEASGRLLTRDSPYEDDFQMRITPFDAPRARYVVAGGDLYVDEPRAPAMGLTDQDAGSASWYAFMVAGMAGPSVIHQVVLNSTNVRRTGARQSPPAEPHRRIG